MVRLAEEGKKYYEAHLPPAEKAYYNMHFARVAALLVMTTAS